MSLVGRIAHGAFEGFVAGASVGAATNGLARGVFSYPNQLTPRGFNTYSGATGAGEGLVKGGFLGALVGGVMGAMGDEHPVASVVDGLFGRDEAGASSGGVSDLLANLAHHLRSS